MSGGPSRRSAVDIRQVVRANPHIVPRQVPDAMMRRMGLREGQTIQASWGGPLLLRRFRNGTEYSRDYAALKESRRRGVCRAGGATDTPPRIDGSAWRLMDKR